MITFCEGAFSAERDNHQWILTEYYDGTDRKGNHKLNSRQTYHATLKQVCSFVIDKICGDCKDAEDIKQLLKSADVLMDEKAVDIAEVKEVQE